MPVTRLSRYTDASRRGGWSLLVCTGLIYLVCFHEIVFHLNSLMSSLTLDTIKNYYTFAWHVRYDDHPLHFAGMQYPYGEHVVYTDSQPLITFVLRWLPFLHPWSIGIMHGLIFLSFVFTPLVVRRVLLELEVNSFLAWTGALGISLLSPQFLKMNAGHFGLCYTIIIPAVMLLVVRFIKSGKQSALAGLFVLNSGLFWLHPYIGFGTSAFSFVALFLNWFAVRPQKITGIAGAVLGGIVPILLFQVAMKITDHHPQRPTEPYGLDVMVENAGSLLTPGFGPFKNVLSAIFPAPTDHFEGHSYLGITNIVLLIALPFLFIYLKKRQRISRTSLTLLISSLIFLPIAFGWHHHVLGWFNISSPAVNQFRAVSRFAWFVYYGIGIFLLFLLSAALQNRKAPVVVAGSIYLLLSLTEAHGLFTLDRPSFWQWRNVFNARQLTDEEKTGLQEIGSGKYQALIPLPVFHGGTEMYDRPGRNNSMLPAFIYSYHSGLPIISMMASRSSHTESKEMLSLLNSCKQERPVLDKIGPEPFFVIRTKDNVLPDEDRLWKGARRLLQGDSLSLAKLDPTYLLSPVLDERLIELKDDVPNYHADAGILYVDTAAQDIFQMKPQAEMQTFFSIKKDTLPPGRYVISFHYHYEGDTYRALSSSFVFAEDPESGGQWLEYIPVRMMSGFYEGFGVFETYADIESGKGYNLVMHSSPGHSFRISDILVRAQKVSVVSSDGRMVNNYPR